MRNTKKLFLFCLNMSLCSVLVIVATLCWSQSLGPVTGLLVGELENYKEECVFPFIYKGRSYSQCHRDDEVGKGRLWCATTKNYDQDKKMIYCNLAIHKGVQIIGDKYRVEGNVANDEDCVLLCQRQRDVCDGMTYDAKTKQCFLQKAPWTLAYNNVFSSWFKVEVNGFTTSKNIRLIGSRYDLIYNVASSDLCADACLKAPVCDAMTYDLGTKQCFLVRYPYVLNHDSGFKSWFKQGLDGMTVRKDVRLIGSNYNVIRGLQSPQECRDRCLQDKSCNAITFDYSKTECFLVRKPWREENSRVFHSWVKSAD